MIGEWGGEDDGESGEAVARALSISRPPLIGAEDDESRVVGAPPDLQSVSAAEGVSISARGRGLPMLDVVRVVT